MIQLLMILLAPLAGGLLVGVERKMRARIQRRQGPPVLQPFYDFFKLLQKRPMMVHSLHALLGIAHFFALWVTLALFILGADLLFILFFHLLSHLLIVMAGFSVRSAYSQVGANRELIALLCTEPLLFIGAVAFYLEGGSFAVSDILSHQGFLPALLPIFIAYLIILPVRLKKSPFDAAEAHQEIIGGVEIEYSGFFYEAVYTAKWIETLFAYLFLLLFFGANWVAGLASIAVVFVLMNLLDNATARVSYKQMLIMVLGTTLALGLVNLWMV